MDSLNEALKFEPGYPEAHLEMALVMQGQGNFDRARDHLAKAQAAWVDADPDFSLAVQAREMVTRLN
jgi:Tfp pilus assembly protein PilF